MKIKKSTIAGIDSVLSSLKEKTSRKSAVTVRKDILKLETKLISYYNQLRAIKNNNNNRIGGISGNSISNGLKQIPEIRKVEIDNNVLCVSTRRIYIVHKNVTYNIGRFEIRIDYNYLLEDKAKEFSEYQHEDPYFERIQNGEIIGITNIDKIIDGDLDHPHIESGAACFGEISRAIPDLMSKYLFVELVQMIIGFLKSYNDAEPFEPIESWPIKRSVVKKAK